MDKHNPKNLMELAKVAGLSETELRHAENLDLRGEGLASLPEDIGDLTNLKSLDLDLNQLSKLPDGISYLTNLELLDLGRNQLITLPETIRNLTNLKSLVLGQNQLSELPDYIGDLTNLISLNLRYNQLSELPETIGNLTNLTELDLRRNQLNKLSKGQLNKLIETIGKIPSLTELDLSGNELSKLPDSIGNLNLTELDLSGNELSKLPDSIGNLTNLIKLDLSYNQFSELPDSIGNLTNLTELDLWGNQLNKLSMNQLNKLIETIGEIPNLTELDLRQNQLIELPEKIGNLTDLTELNLDRNHLSELPETIGDLTNLTYLDLNSNQLSELPDTIGNLTNLTELDLSYNQLSELPYTIGNLSNLRKLDLYKNQLSKLLDSIGNLTNLTQLDLSNNRLSELPEAIGNLTNLTKLDLRDNQLSELPGDIMKLKQLESLELRGNRLKRPFPQSIANWGSDVVLGMLELGGHKLSGPKKLFVSVFRVPPSYNDPISRLALTECFAAFITACWLAIVHPVWLTGACIIAPLFLLRTRQSSNLALKFTDRLGVRLKIKDKWDEYGIRQLYRYPAYAMGAWGIKVWASLRPLFRKPGKSARYLMQLLIALRKNYNYQLTRINIRTAPEIVPGLENRYADSPRGLLSFFEIGVNPAEAVHGFRRSCLLSRFIQIVMMAIIFFFAFIYRLTVKLSLIFYFPVFVVGCFTEEKPAKSKKESDKKENVNWKTQGIECAFIAGFEEALRLEEKSEKSKKESDKKENVNWIRQWSLLAFFWVFLVSLLIGDDLLSLLNDFNWYKESGLAKVASYFVNNSETSFGRDFTSRLLEIIRWGFIWLFSFNFVLKLLTIFRLWNPDSLGGTFCSFMIRWIKPIRDISIACFIGYMMQFYFSAILYDKISDWFVSFMI